MVKPIVKLTTVEDSPEWLDQRLVLAYWETEYRVVPLHCGIGIGKALPDALQNWLQDNGVSSFVFITAANPRSERLSFWQNRHRNKLLLELLSERPGLPPFSAVHLSRDGLWPVEPAFWVLQMPLEEAVDLGRRFNQHAIVFWESGQLPALYWLSG